MPEVNEDVHRRRGAVGQRERDGHYAQTGDTSSFTHTGIGARIQTRPALLVSPLLDKRVAVGLGVVQVGFDELGQLCRGRGHWSRSFWFKLQEHHLLSFLPAQEEHARTFMASNASK